MAYSVSEESTVNTCTEGEYEMTEMRCINCQKEFAKLILKYGVLVSNETCPNCGCYGVLSRKLGQLGSTLSGMCGSTDSAKVQGRVR